MTMIVGLYDDLAEVEHVVNDLKDNGFSAKDIHMATHDRRAQEKGSGGFFDSLSNLFGRQPQNVGDRPQGLIEQMTGWGVPNQDAQQYAEAVRRGNTLLMVEADGDQVEEARQIMDGYDPIDIQERSAQWQQAGWQGYDPQSQPYTDEEINQERRQYARPVDQGDETHIPIVEEEMRVGKRQVQRGGVRVHSYTTEQPFEETHTLRDETVNVERRPADRPATDADLQNAFQDRTFEVAETDEELITDKQARVTGEVVVSKQAGERSETVRDTVRRTEVETDDLQAGQTRSSSRNYGDFSSDFRQHYDMLYGQRGGAFSTYEPAYRFGYDLAGTDRFSGQKWSDIEPTARQQWQRSHPDTAWDNVKDAIRFSWERAASGGQDMGTGTGTGFADRTGYDQGRYTDVNNP